MDFDDIKDMRVSDLEARQWYKARVENIPELVDASLSLEQQARQAHGLRNQYRAQAREIMADVQKRNEFDREHPHSTFDGLLNDKMIRKGLSLEDAYRDIIKTASSTNKAVNSVLGME